MRIGLPKSLLLAHALWDLGIIYIYLRQITSTWRQKLFEENVQSSIKVGAPPLTICANLIRARWDGISKTPAWDKSTSVPPALCLSKMVLSSACRNFPSSHDEKSSNSWNKNRKIVGSLSVERRFIKKWTQTLQSFTFGISKLGAEKKFLSVLILFRCFKWSTLKLFWNFIFGF